MIKRDKDKEKEGLPSFIASEDIDALVEDIPSNASNDGEEELVGLRTIEEVYELAEEIHPHEVNVDKSPEGWLGSAPLPGEILEPDESVVATLRSEGQRIRNNPKEGIGGTF